MEAAGSPNYSNILGNLAAGGLANLYYPASDRGAALTFERALTVTAEGAIGSIFVEFWPTSPQSCSTSIRKTIPPRPRPAADTLMG